MSNHDWKVIGAFAGVGGAIVAAHGITSQRWQNWHTVLTALAALAAVAPQLSM